MMSQRSLVTIPLACVLVAIAVTVHLFAKGNSPQIIQRTENPEAVESTEVPPAARMQDPVRVQTPNSERPTDTEKSPSLQDYVDLDVFADLPEEFDPYDLEKSNMDPALWALARSLVLGFKEDGLYQPGSENLRSIARDIDLQGRPIDNRVLGIIGMHARKYREYIRPLKKEWGREWRMAEYRIIRSGTAPIYRHGEFPARSIRRKRGDIVSNVSGPSKGLRRLVVTHPPDHPDLYAITQRVDSLIAARNAEIQAMVDRLPK